MTPESWYLVLDRLIVGAAQALGACMRGGRLLLVQSFVTETSTLQRTLVAQRFLAPGVMRYLACFLFWGFSQGRACLAFALAPALEFFFSPALTVDVVFVLVRRSRCGICWVNFKVCGVCDVRHLGA